MLGQHDISQGEEHRFKNDSKEQKRSELRIKKDREANDEFPLRVTKGRSGRQCGHGKWFLSSEVSLASNGVLDIKYSVENNRRFSKFWSAVDIEFLSSSGEVILLFQEFHNICGAKPAIGGKSTKKTFESKFNLRNDFATRHLEALLHHTATIKIVYRPVCHGHNIISTILRDSNTGKRLISDKWLN